MNGGPSLPYDTSPNTDLWPLTPRQRDVLRGVMAGKLSKAIAHQLGLSVRTVEAHRAAIMARMGARSLSDLIRIGIAAGL